MPETPVEFVDGLGRRIEPVDGVTSIGQRSHLSPVVRMSNGRSHEIGFPGQPFEGRRRLVNTATTPPEQRFVGDGVGLEAAVPVVTIASRRNRHLFEGIEPGLGFKLAFECHTPLFEEQDVRLAVLEEFSSKLKHVPFTNESVVPPSEGIAVVDGHPVGHVIVFVG